MVDPQSIPTLASSLFDTDVLADIRGHPAVVLQTVSAPLFDKAFEPVRLRESIRVCLGEGLRVRK
jgi:hypothetical protein